MTQSTLLTRCPHCETRFRVTQEQLGVAKGKVRCGHCMAVFDAREHQQAAAPTRKPEEPESSSPPSPSPSPEPEPQAEAESPEPVFTEEDEFVFEDNPDEDAAEGAYAGTSMSFTSEELSDSFRSFDEKSTQVFEEPAAEEESFSVDESWAEAILQDEGEAANARSMPEEPSTPPPEPPAQKPNPAPPRNKPPEEPREPAEEQPPRAPLSLQTEDEPGRRPESDALVAERPYHNLAYEPIALGTRQSRGRMRQLAWTVIILALLGGIIAQVTYFQFDRLSGIPELRPLYEKSCEMLGCELKPLVAVGQIKSRKLVVRTAPEDRNSLIVDAVIVNEAAFDQPFPAIGLTFSNLNGDIVAQSLFSPEDYIAGEATDLTTMPPDTPVRIAITIRDPGRDAVNYNITFRPNDSRN